MAAIFPKMLRSAGLPLAALMMLVGAPALIAQQAAAPAAAPQPTGPPADDSSITHSRGQSVIPIYNGWHPNKDGTIDLWFGYLSNNWRQELDVPIGVNNNISAPYGPDAGQPTHLFPRNNRFQFKIQVPGDFGKKEIIWTLTTNGRTYRAYATLNPSYIKDDEGMQREYFGGAPPEGNDPPEITMEGPATRSVKVGDTAELVYKVIDDGKSTIGQGGGGAGGAGAPPSARATRNAAAAANARRNRASVCGDQAGQAFFCGEPNEGAGSLFSVKGLRSSCYLYRGDPEVRISSKEDYGQATLVAFDPPQEKVWEDHRGGSPWATGYTLPPIPKDNTWHVITSFARPGTFVVRCQAHDGLLSTFKDVTFEVTP